MTKKEDLQQNLQELEARLIEFQEKEDQTAEDLKTVNEVCDQIEEVHERINTLERAEAAVAAIRAPTSAPADPGQPNAGQQDRFESFGEYLQAVARASSPVGMTLGGKPCGMIDRRLIAQATEQRSTGLEESTPSLGGFLVQKDYASQLITKAHETSILYNRVRKIPISTNANGIKIPGVDETSRADGSRWGGIRMYWLEEGGTKTASKPKFLLIEMDLKKLIGLCYATDELLQDAAALGAVISQGFAEEMGIKLDDAIVNGTGAGQPLGILNAACLVSQAKETGQPATTILWDNLKKMYARIWARSRPNMIWLINQDCLPQLMSLTQPVGTGGVPVWIPANSAAGAPHETLLGRPMLAVEQCQTLGTVGDIILADFSQYLCIEKGGMQTASSIHVQFTTDETVFRFVFRVDGQPLWNAALTPYKGTSSTQSPFVALATRS